MPNMSINRVLSTCIVGLVALEQPKQAKRWAFKTKRSIYHTGYVWYYQQVGHVASPLFLKKVI